MMSLFRAVCLLIIITVSLIAFNNVSAQEQVRVVVGNPDCSAFDVPANGEVSFPLWVELPRPIGAGIMVFNIIDSLITGWVQVDFLYGWNHVVYIEANSLRIYLGQVENYPNGLFCFAYARFSIDADTSLYGDTISAVTAGPLLFTDTTGAFLFEADSCVSPLCVECQTSADDPASLPDQISFSAYPNPFNSSVAISLSLPHEGELNLAMYDIAGRLVQNLYNSAALGNMRVIWDGTDEGGNPVASGVYFYRIEYYGRVYYSKVTLLR